VADGQPTAAADQGGQGGGIIGHPQAVHHTAWEGVRGESVDSGACCRLLWLLMGSCGAGGGLSAMLCGQHPSILTPLMVAAGPAPPAATGCTAAAGTAVHVLQRVVPLKHCMSVRVLLP